MWIVCATRPADPFRDWPFPDNYFPRQFHYKRDAIEMAEEVRLYGGWAVVEKKKKKETK